MENASGARNLTTALKSLCFSSLRNPFSFVAKREFRLVFGLYTATYLSANAADTLSEHAEIDSTTPKFVSTTATNMSFCIYKDRAFAQMFGVITPSNFPLVSIGLFAIRDCLTIAASFNAPNIVADKLKKNDFMESENAMRTAQLLCPAVVQLVSCPLHLLALDFYNNKGASIKSHAKFVQREYIKSTLARIGRIAPAFGIGGIGNRSVRNTLLERFT
jgi:hypothetical protein